MHDGNSASIGSKFLFILLGLAGVAISIFAILFVSFWDWVRGKPTPLTPEGRKLLQHLKSLSPDEQEAFLAKFGEKEQAFWRKQMKSHTA